MKIERVDDNQIRCTLASFDLSVRNINLVGLTYDTEKARKLFREMIQKASNEVSFEAKNIPLMVEAVPLSSESIMLAIAKIEDPEELDTRSVKSSPFTEKNRDFLLSQLANEFLEGTEDPLDYLEPDTVEETQNKTDSTSQGGETVKKDTGVVSSRRIFRFDSPDHISGASKAVEGIYTSANSLYKKPGTRRYYLIVKRQDCTDLDFFRVCNTLAEYAAKLPNEGANKAYFKGHYEAIIQDQTLQNLTKI